MAEIISSSNDESAQDLRPREVSLNQNIVDGSEVTGGYDSWQLTPGGSKIAPVKGKTKKTLTVSGANTLILFKGDSRDVYKARSDIDFHPNEEVSMEGPTEEGNNTIVRLRGSDSSLVANFIFSARE